MLFNQYRNNLNLNIKYYKKLIEVNIENIKNNIERFKIYENVLEIFKLNKVNMIIKYQDRLFFVYDEIDLNVYTFIIFTDL